MGDPSSDPDFTEEQLDAVLAWMSETGGGYKKASQQFGIPYEVIRDYKRGRETNSGRKRGAIVPASDLPEDDREQAIRIVRNSRTVLDRYLQRLVEASEDGDELPFLEGKAAQALLNLQRSATTILETHPDLMRLARDQGDVGSDSAIAGEDALGRLQRALGGSGSTDEG